MNEKNVRRRKYHRKTTDRIYMYIFVSNRSYPADRIPWRGFAFSSLKKETKRNCIHLLVTEQKDALSLSCRNDCWMIILNRCASLSFSQSYEYLLHRDEKNRKKKKRTRSLISIVRSCFFRLIHESLRMHIPIVFRATNIIQTRLCVHTQTRARTHTHTHMDCRERRRKRRNRERKISLYFPFADNTPIGHTRNGSKSSFFLFHTVRHIKRTDRHCLLIKECCLFLSLPLSALLWPITFIDCSTVWFRRFLFSLSPFLFVATTDVVSCASEKNVLIGQMTDEHYHPCSLFALVHRIDNARWPENSRSTRWGSLGLSAFRWRSNTGLHR